MLRRVFFLVALAITASSCGAKTPGTCEDLDGDGFGAFCDAGVDCDDTNPARNVDCDAVPPPDCDADPIAPGCACLFNATAACYSGPEETLGIAACVAGFTACRNGHWGLCTGETLPANERCNGLDDDCDGFVDDGVRSPCGGCDPTCTGTVWGEAPEGFVPGDETVVTERGELTLARTPAARGAIFIPNSVDDTVSRIDPVASIETARYPSGGDDPSRVAIDYLGDAWITNRAFGGPSTVRRIAGDPSRCVDRDVSGGIDTSTGPSDVRADDECVLLTADVGAAGEVARAIAIDGSAEDGGDPWVGLFEGQAIVHLASETGQEIERIETPGFRPYSAAFDAWGTLYMSDREGHLLRLDRAASPLDPTIVPIPFACFHLYALAIEGEGRVVLTGFDCDQVILYEPAIDRFRAIPTLPSVRGVVAEAESAWLSHTDGRATRISIDPFRVVDTFDLASSGTLPIESIGIALDEEGDVWIASSRGGPAGLGLATELDPATGVRTQVPIGAGPHSQGDLSGGKRLGTFVPVGAASRTFTGCGPLPTEWIALHIEADLGAAGSVEIEARHAPSEAELASASFQSLGVFASDPPPYPLSFPDGGAIEVRLTLRTSARDGAPRVRRVGVEWSCGIE